MLLGFQIVALLLVSTLTSASTCSVLPKGWFTPTNVFHAGVPPPGALYTSYLLKPDFLTCAELINLHAYCVARINKYRTGELKFTGGIADPALGTPPLLIEAKGIESCQSALTLGDLVGMGGGGCGNPHANAWSCKESMGGKYGTVAQNAACPRYAGNSYADMIGVIDASLQQMWDEGLPKNANGVTGHWKTMKNPTYTYASCGFAFAKMAGGTNAVNFNQNFANAYSGTAPTVAVTVKPTTRKPTVRPSLKPTAMPTTPKPTSKPSKLPTRVPSKRPTKLPTAKPTKPLPTLRPSTSFPTKSPTKRPTVKPTRVPTPPTGKPTAKPTKLPTNFPTKKPTASPTAKPTKPTRQPTAPTKTPTVKPTTLFPTRTKSG